MLSVSHLFNKTNEEKRAYQWSIKRYLASIMTHYVSGLQSIPLGVRLKFQSPKIVFWYVFL